MTGKQLHSSAPTAVVLSGNLGPAKTLRSINQIALAITRSLGRQRVPIYRFHPDRSLYDLNSRYCTHIECPNLYDERDGLVDALKDFAKSLPAKPVLFSASDGAASFVSQRLSVLESFFAVPGPSWECVNTIQNKQRLYERAGQVGLAIAKTAFPTSRDELLSVVNSMSYPAVVKPLTSHHWKTAKVVEAIGHKKAIEVAGPDELIEAYDRVGSIEPRLMVQEIIPGPDTRLLTFLGYIGCDGRPLAGCVRMKLRQSPPRFGYCCLTETVRDREVLHSATTLLTALDYRGIGCVEFKRDPRDGILKLIEINARAVRTTGAAIGAGVDLPYIAYRDSIGRRLPRCFKYRSGLRWMHLRDEMLAARELIRQGQLTLRQWVKVFHGPLVFCEWANDDPWPFILVWRQFASHCIRRLAARARTWIHSKLPRVHKTPVPGRQVPESKPLMPDGKTGRMRQAW